MGGAIESHEILGIKLTPTTISQLLDLIAENVARQSKCILANQNLHGLYKYFTDERFHALHQQAYVHIDGTPVVWLAQLCGIRVGFQHRIALLDYLQVVLKHAAKNSWRVFYVGGMPDVLERGLENLRRAHPGVVLDGHHGYFDVRSDSPDNLALIQQINAFAPQVLMVGMGMGRQERWILANLDRLKVNAIWTSGASIEYFAGVAPIAPRWLGRVGLEWTYRLCGNPRRFAWRYLVEPWLVVCLVLRHQLRQRSVPRIGNRGDG